MFLSVSIKQLHFSTLVSATLSTVLLWKTWEYKYDEISVKVLIESQKKKNKATEML